MKQIEHPLTIFFVGATGDLAKKKILKALYQLFKEKLLPEKFTLIGNARREYSREEFQEFARHVIQPVSPDEWQTFSKHLEYVSGDISQPETFTRLLRFHSDMQSCGNHLWYVATLPTLYLDIIRQLKMTGFHKATCGWTKFLLEKPFGTDLTTSRSLNQELLSIFEEDQIYRIDHFLGKETVQNLLVFRFANGIFEHLWNHNFIDHIQITASEMFGVNGREIFYDNTGTIRDVVENHLFQMMAMTLMEQPDKLDAQSIRDRRREVLANLVPLEKSSLSQHVALGQYEAGNVNGEEVQGYLKENNIPADSRTETAVAIKCLMNSDRWRGVPIYLRAGKRLAQNVTEISIQFKEPKNSMFKGISSGQKPNVLTLRIGPNEGVVVRLHVKKPGLTLELQDVPMQFCYQTEFQMDLVEAYVKLIYDAVQGDASLFPQADEIDAAWLYVQPLLDAVENKQIVPESYVAGSWGPESFAQLLAQDGRTWIEPSVDVCQLPTARKE